MKQLRHDSVPDADPLHAGRDPFQTFAAGLCVVASVPLLDGSAGAGSVSALLPGWLAFGWGLSLCLGSVVALVGSYWPRAYYATALTLEQAGLGVVGPAALVYAVTIPL